MPLNDDANNLNKTKIQVAFLGRTAHIAYLDLLKYFANKTNFCFLSTLTMLFFVGFCNVARSVQFCVYFNFYRVHSNRKRPSLHVVGISLLCT